MPKLYDYLGLIVLFYANEREPVHVHGKREGRESRAELIYVEGQLREVRFTGVRGKEPLAPSEMADFRDLVTARADEIVQRWIDFFVLHKTFAPEHISRRIR